MKKQRTIENPPLLQVTHLKIEISSLDRLFYPVKNISFEITPGKIMALVGGSGSGKTMTANALLGILPENARQIGGLIKFNGAIIKAKGKSSFESIRGKKISLIAQEPLSALNPVIKIGKQLRDIIKTHHDFSNRTITAQIMNLLNDLGLTDPERVFNSYPHQLSGGMAQRILIAMALSCQPELVIADEPTTALDISTQLQIMTLLTSLQKKHNFALILITHDLEIVAKYADEVTVLHQGEVVEQGKTGRIISQPEHPVTKLLLRASFLPESSTPEEIFEKQSEETLFSGTL